MEKIKVLFVTQSKLQHYRVPVFRLVNRDPSIELTIAHCGDRTVQDEIPEILLKKKKFNSYYAIKDLDAVCENYDVVLCMFYYNNVSFLKSILKKKHKLVLWSIGVPASYNRKYGDASLFRYRFLNFFQRRANALVFYSDAPLAYYKSRGISVDEEKVFIANNTVEVVRQPIDNESKNTLLFIGTLYLEKGLQILLNAYKNAYEINHDLMPLNIVGGGTQLNQVRNWVEEAGLDKKISVLGPIYDPQMKAELFRKSIACISPMQAGLSVLESMGYGVPFITSSNAITGGEAFNIKNGENGLLMSDVSQLQSIILDIDQNRDKYLKMGEQAYDYYWNNRTIDIMANGIISAVLYAYHN